MIHGDRAECGIRLRPRLRAYVADPEYSGCQFQTSFQRGKKKAARDRTAWSCGRRESNPHTITGVRPWNVCVYQFRHFRRVLCVSKAGTKVSVFRFDANIFFKNINFIRRGRSGGAFWALPESVKVPPETLETSAKKAVVIFGKRRKFSGSGGIFRFSGGFLKLFFDLKKFTCFAFSDAIGKSYF